MESSCSGSSGVGRGTSFGTAQKGGDMSRSERQERRATPPFVDPWFGQRRTPAVDSTGYLLHEPNLDQLAASDSVPDAVQAPLGGRFVGRLATTSYGSARDTPGAGTPGGVVPTESREYVGDWLHRASGAMEPPGACSTRAGLGLTPAQLQTDATAFGDLPTTLFLGEPHAQGRAPLSKDGTTGEHALGLRLASEIPPGLYDGGPEQAPPFHGGRGGDFGPGSRSQASVLPRRVDAGDEYRDDGW